MVMVTEKTTAPQELVVEIKDDRAGKIVSKATPLLSDHTDDLMGLPANTALLSIKSDSTDQAISKGASGLITGYMGLESSRKGYLQAVAVAVVLMSRSRNDYKIKNDLVEYMDPPTRLEFRNKPKRVIMAKDIVCAMDRSALQAMPTGYRAIQGSVQTRLVQAIEHVFGLGDDLQQRIDALDDFPNFSKLNSAVETRKAQERGLPTPEDKQVRQQQILGGLANFAQFVPPMMPAMEGGYVLALCRKGPDGLEVVGWSDQAKLIQQVQKLVVSEYLS